MPGLLLSLNTSPLRELTTIDGRSVPSGIFKRAVSGPRKVERPGIEGDARADATAHGGPAKAVYAYPSEHYPFWATLRAQFGVAAWGDELPPGALGENLTLAGLFEIDVWVGDVLRFPDCALGVSGPRLPCFKLDAALGFEQASNAMAARAWCGFYLAVHEPGTIRAGESFELIPGPRAIGVTELFRARIGA
jgi:MOSC domain-containing protein YiiM